MFGMLLGMMLLGIWGYSYASINHRHIWMVLMVLASSMYALFCCNMWLDGIADLTMMLGAYLCVMTLIVWRK